MKSILMIGAGFAIGYWLANKQAGSPLALPAGKPVTPPKSASNAQHSAAVNLTPAYFRTPRGYVNQDSLDQAKMVL